MNQPPSQGCLKYWNSLLVERLLYQTIEPHGFLKWHPKAEFLTRNSHVLHSLFHLEKRMKHKKQQSELNWVKRYLKAPSPPTTSTDDVNHKNCFGKNRVVCSSILRCVPRLQPAPVSFCPFGDHLNVLVTSWVIQFGAPGVCEVEGWAKISKWCHQRTSIFSDPVTEVKDPPKEIGICQCIPMLISSVIYGL